MKSKEFEWNMERPRRPETYALLVRTQYSGISEKDFIEQYTQLPGSRRPPSKAKDLYRYLSKTFNFFKTK